MRDNFTPQTDLPPSLEDISLLSNPRPDHTLDNDFGDMGFTGLNYSDFEPVPLSPSLDPTGSIYRARMGAQDYLGQINERKKQCLIEIQSKNRGI